MGGLTIIPAADILNDMNLREIYSDIGTGWYGLLDTVSNVTQASHGDFQVTAIIRHNGMLQVTFTPLKESPGVVFIMNAVTYRIERLSARICEGCGQHGNRRTELPTTQTLCVRCYALKYSEFKDPQT